MFHKHLEPKFPNNLHVHSECGKCKQKNLTFEWRHRLVRILSSRSQILAIEVKKTQKQILKLYNPIQLYCNF